MTAEFVHGTVRPASLSSRFAAAVIDLVTCLVASYSAVPIVLVLLQVGGILCLLIQLSAILAYFAILPVVGGTLGMRALSLRMAPLGRRGPMLLRTIVRASVVVPSGIAASALVLIAYAAWMGHLPSGAENNVTPLRIAALTLIAAPWLGGALWMLVDARRQPLHDRLVGVRVFDTSPVRPSQQPPPRVATPVGPVRERTPLRPILRWFVVTAVIPIVLAALTVLLATISLLVELEMGAAIFGAAITASLIFACWWLLCRAFGKPWRMHWRALS